MRLSRREFVSGMLATPLAGAFSSFASTLPPMKITRIETVYWKSPEDAPFSPNWTWLKMDTDAGISGGKLSKILRTRLAAYAGESYCSEGRFDSGSGRKRLRYADQTGSVEPSGIDSRSHRPLVNR